MPRPARPMTALDPTQTVRWNARATGKPQIWEARSACGRWHYVREESTGTPWLTYDLHEPDPAHRLLTCDGTLTQARRNTADTTWLAAVTSPDYRAQRERHRTSGVSWSKRVAS